MKFVRLVSSLLYETPLFGSRSGFNSNLYCTKAMARRRDTAPSEGSELFSRISPAGISNSIVPILDQWIEEGRSVDKLSLLDYMRKLLRHKRFSHALEISIWMTDKRYIELTPSDAAFRLYLISKTKGIDEAERYFTNLTDKFKHLHVYGALLKCYATEQCVEKAEAVMLKIKNMGSNHVHDYNNMLNLYRKTGNLEKFNALLQEMEENGIDKTGDTLSIQLSTYADVKDVEGMDKIVNLMESDPNIAPYWTTYSAAAAGYTKAGLFDKALQLLKKAEARVNYKGYDAYDYLLTQYGAIGRKDEVLRVWSLYKRKCKVYNKGYRCVLKTLVKLGDIEMAEEIFQEWESQGLTYEIGTPNIMISAHSSRGLIGKAEALLNKAIPKGGKPDAWTWYYMCEGYLLNEQYEKAVEMMKKIASDSMPGRKPVPAVASIKACLKYLKGVRGTKPTEEFVKLLLGGNAISLDQLEVLSVDKDE